MEVVDDNLNCSVNYPFNIYSVAMWHIRSHQKPRPNPTVVCPVGISVHGTVFFWVGNQQPKPVTSMFICIYAIVLDCDVLVLTQHARLCYFTIRFPHANIPWVLTDMHLPPQVLQVCLANGVFCIFPANAHKLHASICADRFNASYQQLLVPESHKFVFPFPQKWNGGLFKVYSIKSFLLYFVNTFL